MARAPRQKMKLLVLRQYLEEYTDEEHPATTAQLIEYLRQQGISAERKSIYDDLETLREFGLDLEKARSGPQTGWYVAGRAFQLPELKLLVDSVQASRFITRKKSLELIDKIGKLTSVWQARQFRRQVWVKNRIKSMNESIYYNVDDIHRAIGADRQIRFRYFRYTVGGGQKLRREGAFYVISPFVLLWDNENYYMVGFDAGAGILKHFRVDKMTGLEVLEQSRDGRQVFQQLDMAAYTDSHFGMFSGEVTPVRLEFSNHLAGAVADRFGRDVIMVPAGEDRFTVTVPVAVNEPFFGWLCSFGDGVRLLGPESAVTAMAGHVGRIWDLYRDDPRKERREG